MFILNIFKSSIYSFIISIPFTLVISIFMIKEPDKKTIEIIKKECGLWLGLVLFINFILSAVLTIIIFTSALIDCPQEIHIKSEVISETEKEIVNLNIKSSVNGDINGNFFVGIGGLSGNIADEEYYYFYTKTDNKYKLEKVLAKDVELIEYDGTPKIVYKEIKTYEVGNMSNGALANFLKLDFTDEWVKGFPERSEETTIYIPKNSIITGFNPNIE